MKYQIYLNKQTSERINLMANHDNKKPSTFIKEIMEQLISVTWEAGEKVAKESKK